MWPARSAHHCRQICRSWPLCFDAQVTTDTEHIEHYLEQLGSRLQEWGQLCPPTLPKFKELGVTGFCWLAPKEQLTGLHPKAADIPPLSTSENWKVRANAAEASLTPCVGGFAALTVAGRPASDRRSSARQCALGVGHRVTPTCRSHRTPPSMRRRGRLRSATTTRCLPRFQRVGRTVPLSIRWPRRYGTRAPTAAFPDARPGRLFALAALRETIRSAWSCSRWILQRISR